MKDNKVGRKSCTFDIAELVVETVKVSTYNVLADSLKQRITQLWLCLIILLIILPASQLHSQIISNPETIISNYQCELLRTADNRLYFWCDSTEYLNDDFKIRLQFENNHEQDFAIEKIAVNIIVSQILPDSIISFVSNNKIRSASVYFDSNIVSNKPLVVGLPKTMVEKLHQTNVVDLDNTIFPQQYRHFENIENAEIALRLGEIDILLLPKNEMDNLNLCNFTVYNTELFIEWYLLLDLQDDDLFAAAACYCLKGLFGNAGGNTSLIITADHLIDIFPYYSPHAHTLFSEITFALRERVCNFTGNRFFFATLNKIRRELQECGSMLLFGNNPQAKIDLQFSLQHAADSNFQIEKTVNQFLRDLNDMELSWHNQLPEIENVYDSLFEDNHIKLSRVLSENIWMIPLGRDEIKIICNENIHYLSDGQSGHKLNNFYRAER